MKLCLSGTPQQLSLRAFPIDFSAFFNREKMCSGMKMSLCVSTETDRLWHLQKSLHCIRFKTENLTLDSFHKDVIYLMASIAVCSYFKSKSRKCQNFVRFCARNDITKFQCKRSTVSFITFFYCWDKCSIASLMLVFHWGRKISLNRGTSSKGIKLEKT